MNHTSMLLLIMAGCAPSPAERESLDFGPPAEQTSSLGRVVTPKADCTETVSAQEIFITDLSVVEDPDRTTWNGDAEDPISGAWSFGRLMTSMAGDADPAEFVQRWLELWSEDTILNGQNIVARPGINRILSDWPKSTDGSLDLTQPPMRLLAIVNRMDLETPDRTAGEGRFVFGVYDADGPMNFTVNLEFVLPLEVRTREEWAAAWHSLGSYTLGSSEYNAALQSVTDLFTAPSARPFQTNGSAISQIRTNEQSLGKGGNWQLREFRLNNDTGFLKNQLLSLTPAARLNNTTALKHYLNENASSILANDYTVPMRYEDAPFRAATVTNTKGIWRVTEPYDTEARHLFSLNTCDGCHGGEAGTLFVHVAPRAEGEESVISEFLTGSEVVDPRDRVTVRSFNEFAHREDFLKSILCGE